MSDDGATMIDTARGPVQVVDRGDGPAVLFVHGSPGGCDQGALLGEFLVEAGFRVIAPSRPGYLATPLDAGRATPAEQADLHAALLDALRLDRVAVACWSGGGPSSYQLAVAHPDRVRAVVALAALSGPYTFEHPSEETALFTHVGSWLMKQLATHAPRTTVKSMLTEEGDLSKAAAKELVEAVWADETRRRFVLRWVDTVRGDRKHGFANDREQYADLALDLAAVASPLLAVHADTDSDVPIEHSRRAVEQVPGAELITVEGGTHISVWTGPDDEAVRSRIVAFLRAA